MTSSSDKKLELLWVSRQPASFRWHTVYTMDLKFCIILFFFEMIEFIAFFVVVVAAENGMVERFLFSFDGRYP